MFTTHKYPHNSSVDSSFLPLQTHFQHPSQNATERRLPGGAQSAGYQQNNLNSRQELPAPRRIFSSRPPAPGGWQWAPNQQHPWPFGPESEYQPTQPAIQPSFHFEPAQTQPTWSQGYPEYGYINPAFFPRQELAGTPYPEYYASRSIPNEHGESNPSYRSAYGGRQQPGYGNSHQAYRIPVANGQAQQTGSQYHSYEYQYNAFPAQIEGRQTANYSSNFQPAGGQKVAERYDNRFSQLEGLMNPLFMRSSSPPLTQSGDDNPREYLLPRPEPSAPYLERANTPSKRLSEPKKLLVVLDLNGTLLLRSNKGSNYTPRPYVKEFLSYCLEHHRLIVWSSARQHNVTNMVNTLFTPEQFAKLVTVWSRDELRLGKHFNAKVQVYKQLSWLWEDPKVQASFPTSAPTPFKLEDGWKSPKAPVSSQWDQSNTVLLDDTIEKAASEPFNLLRVDEFTKENKSSEKDVLGWVLAYLEDLKWEANVSTAMKDKPFVNGEGSGWDWQRRERRLSA